MRDIFITVVVMGFIPWILMRPHVGALVYAWLGLMNPHRLAYGFAYTMPFGTIVALATLISLLFSKEKKVLPWSTLTVLWIIFVVWLNITTVFALVPEEAYFDWDRTMKIQLMVFATMLVMHGRARINAFVWVIVLSLGFFGVKGGIFTIITGGEHLVLGPWESFIAENNALALALLMTLPLMRYLSTVATSKYIRYGLLVAMGLTAMSIISSHSRGAFVAGIMVLLFLVIKSRHRIRFSIAAAILLPVMLMFMPDKYFERMGTIEEFDQDASALGRINAWWFAFNVAVDRPIVGGGYGVFSEDIFQRYAPDPLDFHDSHSIYFEVLGEHGFVGLALFLAIGFLALRTCGKIIREVRDRDDLTWARDLAAMLQVSLVGYATGGAFLGLAYYDLYYNLVALILLLHHHVKQVLAEDTEPIEVTPPELSERESRGVVHG